MKRLTRKAWLFVVTFMLMHAVTLSWKVIPMSQKCLTMFYNNRWVISLVICALCGVAGALIAKEDD